MRPKFARHIHPGFSREPEARCCSATAGMKGYLRNDARRGVPGEATHSRMCLPGSGAVSNHSALQRIPEPGTESNLIGWMIDKVFMKRRRDRMFNGRFYRVGGESCAQALPESLDTASIISWVAEHLSDSSLSDHAADPEFSESGLFPVLSVRMRLLPRRLDGGIDSRKPNRRKNELGEPTHTRMSAITLPFNQRCNAIIACDPVSRSAPISE